MVAVGTLSAPELVDVDDDGDLDLFQGGAGGDTYFLRNVGTESAARFGAPVRNPFGLSNVGLNSAPKLADIDLDGDLDAFIGANSGDAFFFENVGTASTPAFAARVPNPFGLAQLGALSAPEFADIDGDGDLDGFLGSATTIFFPNIGTASAPSFRAPVNPFGLVNIGFRSSPAFVDIDDDGDLDAFIGEYNGSILFFSNSGSANAPSFAPPTIDPFGLPNVGINSSPEFADVDGDGDFDAFIGSRSRGIRTFLNAGTASAPAFVSAALVSQNVGAYTTPKLVDIDEDGDLDLFSGEEGGGIPYFENTGTASSPTFSRAGFNPFGLVSVQGFSAPDFVDIDGDGDSDALIGDRDGNLYLFENDPIETLCTDTPDTRCKSGFGGRLLLVKENVPGREKRVVKLDEGPAVGDSELGNPIGAGGTSYEICFYDGDGVLRESLSPAGATARCEGELCWERIERRTTKTGHLRYEDETARADGITLIKLQPGALGDATLLIKARNNVRKGQGMLPVGLASMLSATTGVTVQIQTSDAGCFSKTFTKLLEQRPDLVKAK